MVGLGLAPHLGGELGVLRVVPCHLVASGVGPLCCCLQPAFGLGKRYILDLLDLAADTWSLGIANPSGLNGKLDQLNALPGDAWLLSETQLSSKGVATLHKGLKMLKSHWKYAIPGSPCRSRRGTDTGAHTGVMVLSKMPARALPHDFSDDVYSTARVQVVGLAVADVWVTLGVLYGLPCNAQHKQARYQTDALLSDLVDRVAFQTVGPRAIGAILTLDQMSWINLTASGPWVSVKFRTCGLGNMVFLPRPLGEGPRG